MDIILVAVTILNWILVSHNFHVSGLIDTCDPVLIVILLGKIALATRHTLVENCLTRSHKHDILYNTPHAFSVLSIHVSGEHGGYIPLT